MEVNLCGVSHGGGRAKKNKGRNKLVERKGLESQPQLPVLTKLAKRIHAE